MEDAITLTRAAPSVRTRAARRRRVSAAAVYALAAANAGVVVTSIVIVRRRLRYEWWYAVHLLAYAGIALSWFHEIPTGNELVLDRAAADYWRGLYLATLAILVAFRLALPLGQLLRHRLRV